MSGPNVTRAIYRSERRKRRNAELNRAEWVIFGVSILVIVGFAAAGWLSHLSTGVQ